MNELFFFNETLFWELPIWSYRWLGIKPMSSFEYLYLLFTFLVLKKLWLYLFDNYCEYIVNENKYSKSKRKIVMSELVLPLSTKEYKNWLRHNKGT